MVQQRRPRRSSIERQIDEALDAWCEAGLVERTGWTGSPLLATPLPKGRGIHFDVGAVERVLRFFKLLRQITGRWAGREFVLLDWQVRWFIAPVFGIKNAAGFRVIRTVWFEIPRKNGKSTLCSGLGLYLFAADREPGAQVYAAASSKDQAGLVFRPSRDMAMGSPALRARLGKGLQRHLLEHPVTHAVFRALSSDAARQHGLNVHGAIIDEVHVHKSADLIDALETGVGSRTQPLVAFITTADDGKDGSVYATKREYIEGLAARTHVDRSFYGVVFGIDHKAIEEGRVDPFSDETLRAANPGADITVLMEYLRSKAVEAQASPAQLNRYLRLHLNVRTKQTVRWLDLGRYDATGQLVDAAEWHGQVVRGGLDLSTTTDLTSLVFRGHDPERGHPVHAMFWLPEERVDDLSKRTGMPLARWASEGWLRLTEGNVVDYAKVRADIAAEVARLGVRVASIGYDPWNASETVSELEQLGFVMVPIRQGYAALSAPAKALEGEILGSTPTAPRIRTGGNPVLRWNADCVEVRFDENGNMKPVKPDRVKSTKRIDGMVALIMATREALFGDEEEGAAAGFLEAITAPCPSCGLRNARSALRCPRCKVTLAAATG